MIENYDLVRSEDGDWLLLVEIDARATRAAPDAARLEVNVDGLCLLRDGERLALAPLEAVGREALAKEAPASVLVAELAAGHSAAFYAADLAGEVAP